MGWLRSIWMAITNLLSGRNVWGEELSGDEADDDAGAVPAGEDDDGD